MNEKVTFYTLRNTEHLLFCRHTWGNVKSSSPVVFRDFKGFCIKFRRYYPLYSKNIKKVFMANEAPWFYLCFSQIETGAQEGVRNS